MKKPRLQLSLVPAIVDEPGLLCHLPVRGHCTGEESVGVTKQVFKLIFFMECRKKSDVTLLLKNGEALIRLQERIRASRSPPVARISQADKSVKDTK